MDDSQTPEFVKEMTQFYHDSRMLVSKCKKPNYDEFAKIAYATGIGFLVMGFVGFIIKLIHIPINHILVGGVGGSGSTEF
jgi:protein transport protein SEC61 subunit gamma-like protein